MFKLVFFKYVFGDKNDIECFKKYCNKCEYKLNLIFMCSICYFKVIRMVGFGKL